MTSEKIDAETSRRLISRLPHRYPFLLVDRIVEYEPGKQIVGVKGVTHNEPFFVGHFPDFPVMPGVLIMEAMNQTGGVLAIDSTNDKGEFLPILTRIEKARFRKPEFPGNQLVMKIEVTRHRHPVWWFQGKGYVDGELMAEGTVQATMGKRPA
ncbi:MAG: 3-hydroxyacyl-ACP dehydratase FabZ [bacterium]